MLTTKPRGGLNYNILHTNLSAWFLLREYTGEIESCSARAVNLYSFKYGNWLHCMLVLECLLPLFKETSHLWEKTQVATFCKQVNTCTPKQENSNLIWNRGVSDLFFFRASQHLPQMPHSLRLIVQMSHPYSHNYWQVRCLFSHLLDRLIWDFKYGPWPVIPH
jgi:hypothetical protein